MRGEDASSNLLPLEPGGVSVGARFAAGDHRAGREPPDDLAAPERAAVLLEGDLVAAPEQVVENVLPGLRLDPHLAPFGPMPARVVEASLRIHRVVDSVDDHLDVPLRLHVPAH